MNISTYSRLRPLLAALLPNFLGVSIRSTNKAVVRAKEYRPAKWVKTLLPRPPDASDLLVFEVTERLRPECWILHFQIGGHFGSVVVPKYYFDSIKIDDRKRLPRDNTIAIDYQPGRFNTRLRVYPTGVFKRLNLSIHNE